MKVTKTIEQAIDIFEDEHLEQLLDKKSTLENTIKTLEEIHAPQKAIDAIWEFSDEIDKQQVTCHYNVLKKLNEIADTYYARKGAKMAMMSDDVERNEFICNDINDYVDEYDFDDISDFELDADVAASDDMVPPPPVTQADMGTDENEN